MHEDGDGTLSGILAVMSTYPESHVPCYQWKSEGKIIAKAKCATVKSLKETY